MRSRLRSNCLPICSRVCSPSPQAKAQHNDPALARGEDLKQLLQTGAEILLQRGLYR